MSTSTELGAFLRTRRAELSPEQVGVVSYGARRVPGLRREELAQLAGVSHAYYTRLEQGQSTRASDGVLDALARALQLDPEERMHLHRLARPVRPTPRTSARPERVRPQIRQLIEAISDVPVLALDRRNDVLAWNALGHALLAGHLDRHSPADPAARPNTLAMLFLDPHTRELHTEWAGEARRAVASLRLTAGQHPGDPALTALIGDLAVRSSEFAALWARHPVQSCTDGTKRYRHPTVGPLELAFTMTTTADNGHRLLMLSAAPDSASADALALLRTAAARASASELHGTN
ncbi:helix-turn-helix transcriptional regulator [Modestobacter sp. VKM Ac-2985]|uniref:helix-turn-helix transcriptional regulator n=1 Tax=Modestobacter sp. VKM Ac-2985 TaxID=3004139 RepID=UPI0022ABAE90|nr:helix-turn-helix transcriptional regulator [Modestobacter sp. VKM Ac-2985]MCZ2839609.1 helix-turn-helix transcriptional regulator [Modestobacter sp. VKM Ac-2985]